MRRRDSQEPCENYSEINKRQFTVFHFSIHLCRFDHHSDFRYVADTFYCRMPGVLPIFRGPWSVKEGVNAAVEPPSSIIRSGTVTSAPLIVVSVHGTERHTVQIGAEVDSVDHTVS